MTKAPGGSAAARLCRALAADAAAAGLRLRIETTDERRWASATFEGIRHTIGIAVAGSAAGARWLAGLPEMEFSLGGHLVADLAVEDAWSIADECRARLEVLTLAED